MLVVACSACSDAHAGVEQARTTPAVSAVTTSWSSKSPTPHLLPGNRHADVTVDAHVEPQHANPGSPVTQRARITNTGNVVLVGLVAELDLDSCIRGIGLLKPGESITASCHGKAPNDGHVSAFVFGRSFSGFPVAAEDDSTITPPPPTPHPRLDLQAATPWPPDRSGQSDVLVHVTNPSEVALRHVDTTGSPRGCVRSVDRMAPGQSLMYRCRAQPRSTVDLTASARAEGGFLPEGAVVTAKAHARTPPTPPSPHPPAPAPPTPAPPPAAVPPPPKSPALPRPEPVMPLPPDEPEREGPLASPAQTAGAISITAVLVMTVSVGALSAAARPGK